MSPFSALPSCRTGNRDAIEDEQHILVVDDDRELRELLSDFLAKSGYQVSVARNGAAMMQTLNSARIDLIVLDILMPGENGLSLCRRLRSRGGMPIIMLTAVGGEVDRIVGLETGADDYLPKPFNPRELVARIRAVLRRSYSLDDETGSARRIFEFGRWRLDATRRRLVARNTGALIDLRPAEFSLLLALVEHPRRTITRDQLLDLARGPDSVNFDRSVDVYVSRVRRRIEDDPKEPDLIKTVRGEGYVFAGPITLNGAPW